MGMKLIPNGITVSEQFAIRNRILNAIDKWVVYRWPGPWPYFHTDNSMKILEEECGIRMKVFPGRQDLYGFEMTDEKKYAWFALKFL